MCCLGMWVRDFREYYGEGGGGGRGGDRDKARSTELISIKCLFAIDDGVSEDMLQRNPDCPKI